MSLRQPVPWPSLPGEIISYAVWFYYRFAVSFRDIEEAMASRGVLVSYEGSPSKIISPLADSGILPTLGDQDPPVCE